VFAPEALVDTYAMTAAHAEQALLAAFNVCEARSPTARLWAEEILRAAGSDARLVRVPDERLPPDLALTGAAQPLLASTGKARRVLGWRETEAGEAVGRSVRWHLANPPPDEADFEADDDALRHAVDAA
jgi:nucleoside-diphosphate-sugar epimerase